MKPIRIQRSRAKGWKTPPNTIYVGRPTKFGNPFTVSDPWLLWAAVAFGFMGNLAGRSEAAVSLYRAWLTSTEPRGPKTVKKGFFGSIGYDDGTEIPTEEHVAGIGAVMAMHSKAPTLPERPDLAELRGKNLSCWCPIDRPCHADVLLELANR